YPSDCHVRQDSRPAFARDKRHRRADDLDCDPATADVGIPAPQAKLSRRMAALREVASMSDWDHRFSTDEYSRRVGLVRDAMGKRGIDLLLVHTPENLFYASGYDTSGYFAYQFIALPLTGEPEILIRRGEAENARRSTIKLRSVFFDLDD